MSISACSPIVSSPAVRSPAPRIVLGALAVSITLSLSLVAAPARADERSRADDACTTAKHRYVITPNASSLSDLARCHEERGRTASAWAEYLEAQALAKREKRNDIELAAKIGAKNLEPKLTKLVITATKAAATADLEVRRDNVPMDRGTWGSAVPVDPGEHVVTATAPGRKTWTLKVVVKPGAHTSTVDVPALVADEAAVATVPVGTTTLTSAALADGSYAPPEEPTTNRGGAQRAVGLTLMGVGLAGVALGTYFGVQTLSKSDAASEACPSSPCADSSAVRLNEDAKRSGTISTVSFAAAGGALLAGAIVFFTAPKNGPRVSVSTAPSFAGVNVGGSF